MTKGIFRYKGFDPVAPSHAHQSLDAAHSKQENEKRRQYEDRILHVDHASFTPLVFTIAGGMSKCTKKILQLTRGNAGGKETTTKKHCIVMDKMQSFILSHAICGKMLTRHKIQKRNSLQHPTHRFAATGFCGTIKRSHICVLRFSLFCKKLELD